MRQTVLVTAFVVAVPALQHAEAQTVAGPEVGFSSIPFQFFPPGARSLAMGATFVGVADDATAAASNPAGLVILTNPEASAHGRYTHFSSSVEGGYVTPSTDTFSPSYVSAVVPVKPFSLSAYYQQVSNIRLDRAFLGRVQFQGQPGTTPFASTSSIDLLVADVGLSAAMRVGGDVAIGATLIARSARMDYANENRVGAAGFEDQATASDSDSAVVFNAGILVNPTGTVSVGAVYKRGGRFEVPYVVDFEGAPAGPVACPGRRRACRARSASRTRGARESGSGRAAPGSSPPTSRWVRYSQLSGTIFRAIPFDIYPLPAPSNELPPSEFRDILQVHGGVERILSGSPTVGLRGGVYHRPNFNDQGGVDAGATFATFGVGLVFGDRGQLDFAGSLSSGVSEGLASFVIRF